MAIGDIQQFRKELDAALESYQAALDRFRAIGDKLGEANVLLSKGDLYKQMDIQKAEEYFRTALSLYQQIGDQYSQARAWYRLGDCQAESKHCRQALSAYRQADKIWREIDLGDLADQILAERLEQAETKLSE
jgi:tetratricopeptide (TPR) repeat protein